MGLVEDKFVPIIRTKVEKYGGEVLKSFIVPDDRRAIGAGVKDLLNCGIDLLVTTAGLSVDPDDVTRQGLADAGATDILYGAPILPGAMTLLAHIGPVQVWECRPAPSTLRPPVSTSCCPACWQV
jgi:formylmethanofuran dehydrogenase subunit E